MIAACTPGRAGSGELPPAIRLPPDPAPGGSASPAPAASPEPSPPVGPEAPSADLTPRPTVIVVRPTPVVIDDDDDDEDDPDDPDERDDRDDADDRDGPDD